MTDRLIAVGDDFTLPSGVKITDGNLPAGSKAATVAAKLDASLLGAKNGAAPLDSMSRVPDANMPTRLQAAGLDATYVRKGEIVLNAKDYGAKGDGVTNDALAIQQILNFAQTAPIRVLFPAGTYVVGQKLYIYSDTTLDFGGATIRRSFNTGPGGVSLFEFANVNNLNLRNGILDGNGANYPGNTGSEGFNIFGGNGISNALFENITFKDVVGDHGLDLSNINGVTVRDCKFMGFKDIVGDRPFSESIQIDPNILGSAGSNNTRIVVTGCYFGASTTPGFGAPAAGIGNHASVPGLSDTNFKITDNTFDGCTYAAIRPYRWSNVTINGNAFINCSGRAIQVSQYSSGTNQPESGTDYAISGNTFTNCPNPIQFPASALGTGNTYAKVKRVSITGNTFTGPTTSAAMQINFVSACTIAGNTVDGHRALVESSFCDGLTITGNHGRNHGQNFIWINESSVAALAGQGLTANIAITGNTGTDIGYRGVHVNCAAKNVTIASNNLVNVSTAAATRDAIAIDSAANGGTIVGNNVADGGATNKPLNGVIVSANVVGYVIGANNLFGTTSTVSNSSPTTRLVGVSRAGTPEGALVAAVGSTMTRTDGGAATTFYVKETGTGNTGWIAK